MGSVGTNDDSAGQRIVSLKVLVDWFFRGCCHLARSWISQDATANDLLGRFGLVRRFRTEVQNHVENVSGKVRRRRRGTEWPLCSFQQILAFGLNWERLTRLLDGKRIDMYLVVVVVHEHVWRTVCSVCATGARVAHPVPCNS